eukprot:GHVQ01020983.1.p1 GENE.GHVQ01020983.1~~GHVQ01020983.1.p1  ORF type:complete len:547 (+),score=89.54 GHVQ01020983.1:79-1719(+)
MIPLLFVLFIGLLIDTVTGKQRFLSIGSALRFCQHSGSVLVSVFVVNTVFFVSSFLQTLRRLLTSSLCSYNYNLPHSLFASFTRPSPTSSHTHHHTHSKTHKHRHSQTHQHTHTRKHTKTPTHQHTHTITLTNHSSFTPVSLCSMPPKTGPMAGNSKKHLGIDPSTYGSLQNDIEASHPSHHTHHLNRSSNPSVRSPLLGGDGESSAVGVGGGGGKSNSMEMVKIGGLFALWYALNVFYNIDNKNALIMLPLPWTVSCIQLFTGWIFFCTMWLTGLRRRPCCHTWEIFAVKIVPQGVCHLFVHIGAVISMKAGAVSFTHIVKAAEPVLTAGLSGAILGQVFAWQTYMSLLPVVAGVGLASVTELSFTWMSFWCAMLSNCGSSLRSILAKQTMKDKKEVGDNLTSANIYSLLTIVASLVCLPLALVMEGGVVAATWNSVTQGTPAVIDQVTGTVMIEAIAPLYTQSAVMTRIIMSGLWYYLYNEVAFGALERVHQLTHAVANTLKRVVIIVATVIVFRNPVTLLGAVGSAIAIAGTLLYSLTKSKYG